MKSALIKFRNGLLRRLRGVAKSAHRRYCSLMLMLSVDPVTHVWFGKNSGLGLEKIGTSYGGWIVPTQLLNKDWVCYCVGVGEDISFDLELIERRECNVYAFDPTPRAIQHVSNVLHNNPKFHFREYGIGGYDRKRRFYAPTNPTHVSHSILNLQGSSEYFDADCKKLSSVMKEEGHQRIDLLKLDIEGAEYEVIESIINENIPIRILCVEFDEAHSAMDSDNIRRIRAYVRLLLKHGYRIVALEPNCNYTFIRWSQFS